MCHHRPVDPLEIEGTSLGLEFASHVWPDRIADHDFARTGGSDKPRAQIHCFAQRSELMGPALGTNRADERDARVDADADWQPRATLVSMSSCTQ